MKTTKRNFKDPNQAEFVGILWQPLAYPFRLHAGDVFHFENRLCRVLRVNESEAVVLMNRPIREFKTRFDKPVRFFQPPKIIHISPQSEVEVLNGKHSQR